MTALALAFTFTLAPLWGQNAGPYDWLARHRIRAAYFGVGQKADHYRTLANSGFNAVFVKCALSPADPTHDADHLDQIATLATYARDNGLRFFPVLNLGGSPEVALLKTLPRTVVTSRGQSLSKTPCPLNAAYWQRVIGDRFAALADHLKARNLPLAGLIFDPEMYGADTSSFPADGCYCDQCFGEFLKAWKIAAPADLEPAQRHAWLQANGHLTAYLAQQEESLKAILLKLRDTFRQSHPEVILGHFHYVDTFAYRAFAAALGEANRPLLICSEKTYATGYTEYIPQQVAAFQQAGLYVAFVPGLWIGKFHAEDLANNAYFCACAGDGYWLFTTSSLDGDPRKKGGDYWCPDSAEEYFLALKNANSDLTQRDEHPNFDPGRELKPARPILRPVRRRKFHVENLTMFGPQPPAGKKQWEPTHLRGPALVITSANSGQEVVFDLACHQVGRYRDAAAFVALDEQENRLAEGHVSFRETKTFRFTAPHDGLFILQLDGGANAYSVNIHGRPEVYQADPALSLCGRAAPLYFLVPAGTKEFTFKLKTGAELETVHFSVVTPVQEIAAERAGGFPTGLEMKITVPAGQDGKPWRLDLHKAKTGVFEDVSVSFSDQIPPYLAESPDRLLVPHP